MNASFSFLSHRVLRVFIFCLVFGMLAGVASAHSLQTKKKCAVQHDHFTKDCNGAGCGSNWQKVEKALGFKSADRVYKGTTAWNCHGRTFDNRRSWVNYADSFLRCDAPFCPAKPRIGDTIIWIVKGQTTHSVTMVGSWKGLDTIVMSKYGVAGQYRHALRNSVKAYGSQYAVTRFAAGTSIYSNSIDGVERSAPDDVRVNSGQELLAARETMPWYDAVLEAEVVFADARAEHVRITGALRPETIEALTSIQDQQIRVQLLVNDLRNREHYFLLGAYNLPEIELLGGMEAAAQLREIAKRDDASRAMVADYLVTLAQEFDAEDAARAVALEVVSPLLAERDRQDLFDSIAASLTEDESYTGEALRIAREKNAIEPRNKER